MLISEGNLTRETLSGKIAVVTGAGAGIGFETARALVWLGAKVIIAEIDPQIGKAAAEGINKELGVKNAEFIQTDVGDVKSVHNLAKNVLNTYHKVDILLNNAAVEPVGAIKDTLIKDWDLSYNVNLRGPVLLCQEFLPGMLKRDYGVIVCVASVGGAYMGPYETIKAAQVELASTLAAECEETGVIVFTIGPGLVLETPGAQKAIPKIAKMMGKTLEEFYELGQGARISMEAAGVGFASAIAYGSNFRGKAISSFEGLQAAGIPLEQNSKGSLTSSTDPENFDKISSLLKENHLILEQRNTEWKTLGVFQRKWMFNDFTKRVGESLDDLMKLFDKVMIDLEDGNQTEFQKIKAVSVKLAQYYEHLQELTRGYVKDPVILAEQLQIQQQWQRNAQNLADLIS
jgi:NAD(P)-dependent dehydrogenase (short-subunit alcohol dehydrogenase family)